MYKINEFIGDLRFTSLDHTCSFIKLNIVSNL